MALPDQLFYNTGISTYIWVLTNRKEPRRQGRVQLIDGRQFFVKMRKSLGNKRNELSQEQIDDLTRIHGAFEDGETRDLPYEDPVTHVQLTRPRVVSKVFDNEDFGYRKVTVEQPLRLNFAATEERIARIEDERAFQNLAKSKKRAGPAHDAEVAEGLARQETIRALLRSLAEQTGGDVVRDREAFVEVLRGAESAAGVKLSAAERTAVLSALAERDPDAEVCRDRRGNPRAGPPSCATRRRCRSVRTSTPTSRARCCRTCRTRGVDESKTKIGYEIPLNRHFSVYEPPRPLERDRV